MSYNEDWRKCGRFSQQEECGRKKMLAAAFVPNGRMFCGVIGKTVVRVDLNNTGSARKPIRARWISRGDL
jgi:hypothetical protein